MGTECIRRSPSKSRPEPDLCFLPRRRLVPAPRPLARPPPGLLTGLLLQPPPSPHVARAPIPTAAGGTLENTNLIPALPLKTIPWLLVSEEGLCGAPLPLPSPLLQLLLSNGLPPLVSSRRAAGHWHACLWGRVNARTGLSGHDRSPPAPLRPRGHPHLLFLKNFFLRPARLSL